MKCSELTAQVYLADFHELLHRDKDKNASPACLGIAPGSRLISGARHQAPHDNTAYGPERHILKLRTNIDFLMSLVR